MGVTGSGGGSRGLLADRRIVIVGAGSGIGRTTAELFAGEGARVAVLDRDLAAARATAEGIRSVAFEVDVRDSGSVTRAIDAAAETLGGIDGVVNTAGVIDVGPLMGITDDIWARNIDVNLTGTFYVCRAACRYLMEANAGTIVNLASGQGLLPGANMSSYAASKGGVISLTRALANELAPGIRVNSICPGMVDTPMTRAVIPDDRTRAAATGVYALKRLAEPLEVAKAILFLTSQESSYVTGVTLAVDGGRTFH